MTRKEITVLALYGCGVERGKDVVSIKTSAHLFVKSAQYHRVAMLLLVFFLLSRDLRLMKAPAVAFIREHFHVLGRTFTCFIHSK